MTFQIARKDGRSNAQVLIDYLADGEPGRIYSYDELITAMSDNSDRAFVRRDICAVVTRAAFGRLLVEQQRTLYNVRGVGYRLARANEHTRLAMERKRRSDTQMTRGMTLLENVRLEELGPAERQVHAGMLMVVGALYQQQRAMERRLQTVEAAIGLVVGGEKSEED